MIIQLSGCWLEGRFANGNPPVLFDRGMVCGLCEEEPVGPETVFSQWSFVALTPYSARWMDGEGRVRHYCDTLDRGLVRIPGPVLDLHQFTDAPLIGV